MVQNSEGYTIEPIIGLEVHVQLATRTKMFCSCAVEFAAPPNSRVCPVCLGLPGALPVVNVSAVEMAVRTGLALHCRIANVTKWDRKSYYYPDLPKNYQISQFDQPICGSGYFELPYAGQIHKIRIRRAHLEEDAGKNMHESGAATAVDLNRTGVPLLEIVTEPDLRSADEAREFAVQLQRLVGYLGVSEANMMKGQLRFEPNINLRIRRDGKELRTPIVEVKNLNSFRSLHGAIEYEVRRQFEEWRETGRTAAVGNKANRGWDDVAEITRPQREKEESDDYRYFPDPDLVPLAIDAKWVQHLQDELPEMPIPRTERFVCEYKLPAQDAPALVDDRSTADLLDHAAESGVDKVTLGKHFLSFWSKLANQRGSTVARLGLQPTVFAELAVLAHDGQISASAAAQIAEEAVNRGSNGHAPIPAARLAEELGLIQNRDAGQNAAWVEQALAANQKAISDAAGNPKKAQAIRGFLAGQVMKISGGKADPKLVAELIATRLGA